MAEYYHVDVTERKQTRTAGARALRREGRIPVVYYYHGEDNHNLSVDQKELHAAINSGNHVFEIAINGKPHYVMIKDVQYHPVTDEIVHLDLMRVRRKEKMTISVPISFEGQSAGVKIGGVMIENLNHLEISCLPTSVPDSIAVDVTDLELGHSLSVGDIQLPKNVELVTDPELTIVTVQIPRTHLEEEAEEEEEGLPGEGVLEEETTEEPASEE
ncbi:MAG: 50S ribosomal protein L25 [FCB group bacterium]|nr:50S ribosomal protein L25 [FCB group bacterium]